MPEPTGDEVALRRLLARAAESVEPSLPVPFDLPGWQGVRRPNAPGRSVAVAAAALAVALVLAAGSVLVLSERLSRRVVTARPALAGAPAKPSPNVDPAAAQAARAPAEIALAVQWFAPRPVRLPGSLPAGSKLTRAEAGLRAVPGGAIMHSLEVWYRLPDSGSLHVWQRDAPPDDRSGDPLNAAGKPVQIAGRTWMRVDLQGCGSSPGASEFSTRFDDGVAVSIDFAVPGVDAGTVLASLGEGRP